MLSFPLDTEAFPSYEIYCAAATAIMTPLLEVYNRQEHTRCCMTIESKERLRPKLPPRSARVFAHFAARANKANLQSSDWWWFYEFVRVCPPRFTSCDLAYLLVSDGFSKECASEIVRVFEHLLDFRRPRTTAETLEYHRIVRGIPLRTT